MTATEATTTSLDQRVLDATTGALELFGIYLGDRLGLYDALLRHGASTAAKLAIPRASPRDMPASGWSSRRWPVCSPSTM